MVNQTNFFTHKRPVGVTIIVIVNIIGWVTTEGSWIFLHLTKQIPNISKMGSFWEKSYIGLVNGFSAADFIWSNLALLVSIFGLWKMKSWGWTAAIAANTIWVYSMTFSLVRDIMVKLTFGVFFFMFFAVFALGSTIYLWRKRSLFWDHATS